MCSPIPPSCFLPSFTLFHCLFSSILPGTIPGNLCLHGRNSSLIFLFLGYNQLTGGLDVTECGSISFIDVTVRSTRDSKQRLCQISRQLSGWPSLWGGRTADQ